MDLTEQVYMSTVKVVANTQSGAKYGTGFFYSYDDICGQKVDVVVTNRHVIDSCTSWVLYLRDKENSADSILYKEDEVAWITHPYMDLAIMPLSAVYKGLADKNLSMSHLFFNKSHIPQPDNIGSFSCIENILFVGYPDALEDECNNLPIVRTGITATPIKYNFQGRPEFLIDAFIYGGSSGSPVFILNPHGYVTNGTYINQPRTVLLGILRAVHQHTLCNTSELQIRIPNGLGYVVKASCLFDFIPLLEQYIQTRSQDTDK